MAWRLLCDPMTAHRPLSPSAGASQAQLKALAQRRAQLRQKRSSNRNRGELDNQALQAVHKQAAELLRAFVAPAAAARWEGAERRGGAVRLHGCRGNMPGSTGFSLV